MAVYEEKAFFVFKFECFGNKVLNKKTLRQVNLSSNIGDEISAIFEDDQVSVLSVCTGGKENEINCSAELDTPFRIIHEFKHKYINVTMKDANPDENNNQPESSPSILKVMMECRRSYDMYPPEREQKNEKDNLYNDILQVMKKNKVAFTRQQVGTVGVHVVQTLTSLFWYLDPFHERLNSRAVRLPEMFQNLKGYRNFKKQHKKVPQIDEIRAEFARKYDSETSSVRAAASASFFGVFSIGGGYSQSVTKTFLDEYKKSRTSSHIDTLGGPIYKPQNYTADLWTDSIDSNMVALDRSGDPIYFSINEQTLPDVPASTVFQVYRQVKDAVDEYYKHNTYRGCTKPNSPNFNFQANVDDGTCTPPETNYTFGGVFQKCSSSGYINLCTNLDQKNPLTGDYSCSEGYDAILIQTGTKSSSTTRHECHSCYLFFHCCDDNTYTARATFSAYWCAASGTVPQNHGFLFGGLYSPMLNNPLTMAKECPTQFYKLKILDNLVVCVSDDYELGYQYSLPFAGFYSCKSGNPLVIKKQVTGLKSEPLTILQSFMMKSGPAAYPKECPKGYSQHLAAVYESCEVNYCVRYGALSPQGLPNIQRPPFIEAPLSDYMQIGPATSSIVFNDDGSVWMTGKEAAMEFGHSGAPKGLGSSTPTGNSIPTPSSSSSSSSSSHGISSGGVAAISIFVTMLFVAIVVIVLRTIRKRRSTLYRYDDCDRE